MMKTIKHIGDLIKSLDEEKPIAILLMDIEMYETGDGKKIYSLPPGQITDIIIHMSKLVDKNMVTGLIIDKKELKAFLNRGETDV